MNEEASRHNEARPTAFTWFVRGIIALVVIITIAAYFAPAFSQHASPYRSRCMNHLKQLALTMRMYANEDPVDFFPPPSYVRGQLYMKRSALYPEYMPDPVINICPSDEDMESLSRQYEKPIEEPDPFFDDKSYFYLGYALTSEEDMQSYRDAYLEGIPTDDQLANNSYITAPGGTRLYRLREGVERFFIERLGLDINDPGASARIQSMIPLLIERIGNHVPDGGNVLFLDGHVEFIRYPGKWPMTESTIAILNELDALGET